MKIFLLRDKRRINLFLNLVVSGWEKNKGQINTDEMKVIKGK